MNADYLSREVDEANELAGLILAGGKGRRMGGIDKGALTLSGIPLVEIICSRMKEVCVSVTIGVATSRQAETAARLVAADEIIIDQKPDSGPLPALYNALCLSDRTLWVSACDMPFVSSNAAVWMKKELDRTGAEAVVPWIGGRHHPLQAVYRSGCREAIASCLEAGDLRMHALLERLHVANVTEEQLKSAGVDSRFVTNINTFEDYERILAQEPGLEEFLT